MVGRLGSRIQFQNWQYYSKKFLTVFIVLPFTFFLATSFESEAGSTPFFSNIFLEHPSTKMCCCIRFEHDVPANFVLIAARILALAATTTIQTVNVLVLQA